jgi:biopolymer transport protein ExbD
MAKTRLSFSPPPILEEPTVNLTPLIDVVFVILIMFIVIAPLLEQDHVELAEAPHLNLNKHQSVQESSSITIHVKSDNTIWLNQEQISSPQIVEKLKQAKLKFPTVTPQIFHDKKAYFGTYQMVKNAAEEAGFSKIDIILKPA